MRSDIARVIQRSMGLDTRHCSEMQLDARVELHRGLNRFVRSEAGVVAQPPAFIVW